MKGKYLLLIVGTTAACVGLTLDALAMLPERPGVTKANFDRVKKGMTRAEADGIFGKPGEVFCSENGCFGFLEWRDDDGAFASFLLIDDMIRNDGTWRDPTETIGEKVRRWFHPCLPYSK